MAVQLQFKRGSAPTIEDGELYFNTDTTDIHVGTSNYIASSREINYSGMTNDDREIFSIHSNEQGELVDYHGNPVRAIGFAAGPALTDLLVRDGQPGIGFLEPSWIQQRGCDQLLYNLKRMASYGIDHIVLTLPWYSAEIFENTYGWNPTSYWSKFRRIMAYAYDCGIHVQIMTCTGEQTHLDFWGKDMPDGTVGWDFIEDSNNPIYIGWKNWLVELCQEIGQCPAISSWQLTDEWNLQAENYSFPIASESDKVGENGGNLPAVKYNMTDGNLSPERLQAQLKLICDTLAEHDPYNRITVGGATGSAGTLETFDEDIHTIVEHDHWCTGLGRNNYPSGRVCNNSLIDWRDSCIEFRRAAADLGKAYIVTATGVAQQDRPKYANVQAYNNPTYPAPAGPGYDRSNHLAHAFLSSGTQLALWWNYARNVSTNPLTADFDIHPDNTEIGSNSWFEDIANANLYARNEGYVNQHAIITSQFSTSSLNSNSLRLQGGANASYVVSGTFKHDSVPDDQYWDSFTFSFWLNMDNLTNTETGQNRQIIIDTIDYQTKAGLQIYVGTNGQINAYYQWPDESTTDLSDYFSNGNNRYGNMIDGGWNHFVIQLDRYTFSTWRNGKKNGFLPYYTGGDSPLSSARDFVPWDYNTNVISIGASNPGGGGAYAIGNIKDVTIFSRALTDFEMHALYLYNIKPQNSVKYEWKFEIDANSTSGLNPAYPGTNQPFIQESSFFFPSKTSR